MQIAVLTVVSIFVFLFVAAFVTHRFIYPKRPLVEAATNPLVTMAAQFAAYLLVLAFMVSIVERRPGRTFTVAIRWDWPASPFAFLFGGVVLAISLQLLGHYLPMPKELPIDKFFRTPTEAWVLSIFGVTFAPLLEELFFRGFLYPVLVRRIGVFFAVLLTAASFSLIHAPQLGREWAPVLVIFVVGLTLTITRAVTKSVSSSLLIHVAYNGTISALLFWFTDGFRHLDKLNR